MEEKRGVAVGGCRNGVIFLQDVMAEISLVCYGEQYSMLAAKHRTDLCHRNIDSLAVRQRMLVEDISVFDCLGLDIEIYTRSASLSP